MGEGDLNIDISVGNTRRCTGLLEQEFTTQKLNIKSPKEIHAFYRLIKCFWLILKNLATCLKPKLQSQIWTQRSSVAYITKLSVSFFH